MPEIIEDGKSGFLVPPRDSQTLANKIVALLKSPQLMEQMGEQGYERIVNKFNWSRVTQKINEKLQTIINPNA